MGRIVLAPVSCLNVNDFCSLPVCVFLLWHFSDGLLSLSCYLAFHNCQWNSLGVLPKTKVIKGNMKSSIYILTSFSTY